jgi:hypothetical protein
VLSRSQSTARLGAFIGSVVKIQYVHGSEVATKKRRKRMTGRETEQNVKKEILRTHRQTDMCVSVPKI